MRGALPGVRLGPRGAARVRCGHPFVSPRDLLGPPDGAGDVVQMIDGKGAALGSALYAGGSRIALRVLSREGRALDAELLHERISAAIARRERRCPRRDAQRLVHGEADHLPGLFIDSYGAWPGGAVVLQTVARAMDARKDLVAGVVRELLAPSLLVLRNDGSARDMDGLPRAREVLSGGPSTLARYHDAGSLMEADLFADGKTGAFLDQQDNHLAAAAWVRALGHEGRRALDAFTYHGGFALSLARAGMKVLACDESARAIARAQRNAVLSGVSVDFRVDNAFSLLRRLEAEGARFHAVVLDPPALAKRGAHDAAQLASAARAYKELNLRGLRLLAPGGLLISCSCSGRLSPFDFEALLVSAAGDAGRSVRVLERRGASSDHPVLLGVRETEYLKCLVLEAT